MRERERERESECRREGEGGVEQQGDSEGRDGMDLLLSTN